MWYIAVSAGLPGELNFGRNVLFSCFWRNFDLAKWVKFGVSGHFPENGLKVHVLMYSDQFQKWFDLGHCLLILLLLAQFYLSEMGQIWRFHVFSGERMDGMPDMWYADVSWPHRGFNFGHSVLIFLLFLLSETGQIWGFHAFSGECMDGMAWHSACRCNHTILKND